MYARQVDGNIALAIAGNKQDSDPADWRVTYAEATSLAAATGATHFRTSARTGDGVDAVFRDAAQRGLTARSTRSEVPGAALSACVSKTMHYVVIVKGLVLIGSPLLACGCADLHAESPFEWCAQAPESQPAQQQPPGRRVA